MRLQRVALLMIVLACAGAAIFWLLRADGGGAYGEPAGGRASQPRDPIAGPAAVASAPAGQSRTTAPRTEAHEEHVVVTVKVLDPNGRRVEGASVLALGERAPSVTVESESTRVEGVAPFTVTAMAPNYAAAKTELIAPGSAARELTIVLRRLVSLTLAVGGAGDGPATIAWIEADGTAQVSSLRLDAHGKAVVGSIPEGACELLVRTATSLSKRTAVVRAENAELLIAVESRPAGKLSVQTPLPAARVEAQFRAFEGEKLPALADVRFWVTAAAGESGTWIFESLPVGTVDVRSSDAEGGSRCSGRAQIVDGATSTLALSRADDR